MWIRPYKTITDVLKTKANKYWRYTSVKPENPKAD